MKVDWKKQFREKFKVVNDCTGTDTHTESCQGCIELICNDAEEIESFIQDLLEKEKSNERERFLAFVEIWNTVIPKSRAKEFLKWRCGKCDDMDVPEHSVHCYKRRDYCEN